MATYHATGVTLVVHKYKGTQRLAGFYTRERGKIEATVSGVGKPGSKLAPAVEPLTLSKLYFAEGRNMDRLTQCEVLDANYDLRNDLQRLAMASYVAELLHTTTEPGHPEPELFDAFVAALTAIAATSQPELVMWSFVLRYLSAHGIGPVVSQCVSCGAALSGDASFATPLGGCVCRSCGAEGGLVLSAATRAALATLQTMPLDRLDRVRPTPLVRRQLRELLRRHIRFHMGVELKSERFLDKMAWGVGPG
jgi:DNA repair protein RecO (recombination protein O)